MKNFLKRRKSKKEAKTLIHHTRHIINMRGDLMAARCVAELLGTVRQLTSALQGPDVERIDQARLGLAAAIEKHASVQLQRGGAFKENFEILVVAVVVAMGLRAYFIQPFKIPTGSMQPTLYGITSEAHTPTLLDRFPLNLVKLAVTGARYSERYALAGGRLGEGTDSADPSVKIFHIGGRRHAIPKEAVHDAYGHLTPEFNNPARMVEKGELLWAGITRRGDHLFVNKVIWHFRKPRRDEIMVFKTDQIPTLEPGTHYIKRMCGLPGEKISVRPPHLVINGAPVDNFKGIAKVIAARDGYAGYQLAGQLSSAHLVWTMSDAEYFALGDNTRNSRDSRYWGPVPVGNLVGPAVFVYWPLSPRWGLIR